MSRINYYQPAFNSQKEKLNVSAEMTTVTISAPVGANKRLLANVKKENKDKVQYFRFAFSGKYYFTALKSCC